MNVLHVHVNTHTHAEIGIHNCYAWRDVFYLITMLVNHKNTVLA